MKKRANFKINKFIQAIQSFLYCLNSNKKHSLEQHHLVKKQISFEIAALFHYPYRQEKKRGNFKTNLFFNQMVSFLYCLSSNINKKYNFSTNEPKCFVHLRLSALSNEKALVFLLKSIYILRKFILLAMTLRLQLLIA